MARIVLREQHKRKDDAEVRDAASGPYEEATNEQTQMFTIRQLSRRRRYDGARVLFVIFTLLIIYDRYRFIIISFA